MPFGRCSADQGSLDLVVAEQWLLREHGWNCLNGMDEIDGGDRMDGMDEYGQGDPLESELTHAVDVNAIVIVW